MIKRAALFALTLATFSIAGESSAHAQMILGGHTVGHTFSGGYAGAPVYTYQEPLAARPAQAPAFNGYLHEPVLSARTVTTAGEWPADAPNPPAPINYATIGPNQPAFYGWNSFWWYDPSQGSPIWNRYNRGRY